MVDEFALYHHYTHHVDLMYNKVMSLTEINDLMPFERDIYLELYNELVEKKNKEAEEYRKAQSMYR